jgi:hypothetical protein
MGNSAGCTAISWGFLQVSHPYYEDFSWFYNWIMGISSSFTVMSRGFTVLWWEFLLIYHEDFARLQTYHQDFCWALQLHYDNLRVLRNVLTFYSWVKVRVQPSLNVGLEHKKPSYSIFMTVDKKKLGIKM